MGDAAKKEVECLKAEKIRLEGLWYNLGDDDHGEVAGMRRTIDLLTPTKSPPMAVHSADSSQFCGNGSADSNTEGTTAADLKVRDFFNGLNWSQASPNGPIPGRRLAASSPTDAAPSEMLILAPLLFILMLVLFMYRKPIQRYFSEKASLPSNEGARFIRKNAPVLH